MKKTLLILTTILSLVIAKELGLQPLLKDDDALYQKVCNQTVEGDPFSPVNWWGVASGLAGVVITISQTTNPVFGSVLGILNTIYVSFAQTHARVSANGHAYSVFCLFLQ